MRRCMPFLQNQQTRFTQCEGEYTHPVASRMGVAVTPSCHLVPPIQAMSTSPASKLPGCAMLRRRLLSTAAANERRINIELISDVM